jgi:hypothetical protein
MELEHVNMVGRSTMIANLFHGTTSNSTVTSDPNGYGGTNHTDVQLYANLHILPNGEKRFDVRVKDATMNIDWFQRNLTIERVHDLGRWIHQDKDVGDDGTPIPNFTHNDATGDTFIRVANLANKLPPQRQLVLSLNNLLTPADKARILLWNTL